jgi:hypothetical protein
VEAVAKRKRAGSAKRAEGVDRVEIPCDRGLQRPVDFLEIEGV